MKNKQLPEIIEELKLNSKRSLAALLAAATITTGAASLTSCDEQDTPLDSNALTTEDTLIEETETKGELTELREITDEELEEMYAKIKQVITYFSNIRTIHVAKEANENNLHKVYVIDTNANLFSFDISENTFLLIKELEDYGRESFGPDPNSNEEYIQFSLTSKKNPMPDDIVRKLQLFVSYYVDDYVNDMLNGNDLEN